MAEEILTAKGNELVVAAANELKEEKKHQKKTVYFQANFVETLITEAVVQLKKQMDAMFLIFWDEETGNKEAFKGPKKKMEAVKGSHLVFVQEIGLICECLEPYNKASLKPKHEAIRQIFKEGLTRFNDMGEGLYLAKNINNHNVTQFAKEMCLFITNTHVVHHSNTPKKERSRVVKEYCKGG
tara:strand:+ start:64 stop:612 length:549 start_codon:yes stop_codon:yes gene_type:complete